MLARPDPKRQAQETEKKGIIAFKDFSDWKNHLADQKKYAQWEIYNIILQRLKEKNVFSDFINTFKEIGYNVELSGFEKLLIQKAGTCRFYSELKALGIKQEDRFPYPGIISFTVNKLE